MTASNRSVHSWNGRVVIEVRLAEHRAAMPADLDGLSAELEG